MPSLISICEELFATKDLYQALDLEKNANQSQIKKAYHKVEIQLFGNLLCLGLFCMSRVIIVES